MSLQLTLPGAGRLRLRVKQAELSCASLESSDPDPDQPHRATALAHLIQQRSGGLSHHCRIISRTCRCLTRERREVCPAELQLHGRSREPVGVEFARNLRCLLLYCLQQGLAIAHILCKGGFLGDRAGDALGCHGPLVNPPRVLGEVRDSEIANCPNL